MINMVNQGRFIQELAPILLQLESLSSSVIKGEEAAIRQVKEHIRKVTIENLEHLPTLSDCQKIKCPIIAADIMLTKGKINVNAFGFSRAGDRMALHDHPNIRGFIKCVRGSMKVRSFTSLEEDKLKQELKCRYEGEVTATTSTDCIELSPGKGDIHEILALEDGTFFFDALYPGYSHDDDCTYYEEEKPTIEPGAVTILKKLSQAPSWQKMGSWHFPNL